MEAPPARGHRGQVPWHFFVLAVLLLIWILPCNGGVEFHYPEPSVTINIVNISGNNERFIWLKGDTISENNRIASYIINTGTQVPGPKYNGRQIIKPQGSLTIKNVTTDDTGYYTFLALKTNLQGETASTHVFVLATVPFTSDQVTTYRVKEGDKLMIVCMPSEPGYSIYWFFNNRRLYFNDRIQNYHQKKIISFMPVKREDAGKYHCKYVKRLSTGKTENVNLEVV